MLTIEAVSKGMSGSKIFEPESTKNIRSVYGTLVACHAPDGLWAVPMVDILQEIKHEFGATEVFLTNLCDFLADLRHDKMPVVDVKTSVDTESLEHSAMAHGSSRKLRSYRWICHECSVDISYIVTRHCNSSKYCGHLVEGCAHCSIYVEKEYR